MFIGLSMAEYWTLTPNQYIKCRKAFNERERYDMEVVDTLNYFLGQYITYGFHNPKKMPKKPYTHKTTLKPMTDSQMEKQARMITMALGGEVK
jgi:hypothetical protein